MRPADLVEAADSLALVLNAISSGTLSLCNDGLHLQPRPFGKYSRYATRQTSAMGDWPATASLADLGNSPCLPS